jgi:ADP-L-glycero-D-manno-heptose 6-epimerase
VDGGGLFNLGSGEPKTWNSLANAIFSALNREPRIEFIAMPEHLRPKYQYFTCANLAKLRAAGFTEPMTPLCEAVKDYVCNYLAPGRHLGDER